MSPAQHAHDRPGNPNRLDSTTVAGGRKKSSGGRVTPKGTRPGSLGHRDPSHVHGTHDVDASSRYTPPVPGSAKASPPWVPVLMFVLLGLGAVVILLYYLGAVPGGRSNWYLLAGLVMVLGGLYTATKYR